MCFMIFYKKKPPLKTIKTVIQKSPKTGIFPKGIVNGFCQTFAHFHLFILVEIGLKYVF